MHKTPVKNQNGKLLHINSTQALCLDTFLKKYVLVQPQSHAYNALKFCLRRQFTRFWKSKCLADTLDQRILGYCIHWIKSVIKRRTGLNRNTHFKEQWKTENGLQYEGIGENGKHRQEDYGIE